MKYGLLLLLPFILLACAEGPSSSEVDIKGSTGVLYGSDSREDLHAGSPFMGIASSTAILVEGRRIHYKGAFWLLNLPTLDKHYPLCSDEKFAKQPALGFCSGVLIAPDKVLTAGHCMKGKDRCADTKFMFGWNLQRAQSDKVANSSVYHCKSVIDQETQRSKGIDYAIVELDRNVLGANPVTIAKDKALTPGEKVLSLSYPLGIPLKQDIGKVIEDIEEKNTLKVEVDTFKGSSGSPLFNSKGELIGILTNGMEDFLEDDIYRVQTKGGCINYHRCKNGSCFGESFFKPSRIDL